MQIINSINKINIEGKTAVALGNFDGIHLGHKVVLEDAILRAREKGLKSVCYTFSNHPFNFITRRDENDPDGIKLICSEKQKIRMLEEMGFDILVNVPFDEEIMTMKALDFIENILVNDLKASIVCVGFNYTFGARAEGKPIFLKEEATKHNIDVRIHDAVYVDETVVSSTLIREKLSQGEMEKVSRYLGREYSIEGIVQNGRKLGSEIGFPTANISASINRAYPPDGVYFGSVILDDNKYRCITNIGTNPTVSTDGEKVIETHIFDFDADCYGKSITIFFEHFHRPENNFGSREALHKQIANDCEVARIYSI